MTPPAATPPNNSGPVTSAGTYVTALVGATLLLVAPFFPWANARITSGPTAASVRLNGWEYFPEAKICAGFALVIGLSVVVSVVRRRPLPASVPGGAAVTMLTSAVGFVRMRKDPGSIVPHRPDVRLPDGRHLDVVTNAALYPTGGLLLTVVASSWLLGCASVTRHSHQ